MEIEERYNIKVRYDKDLEDKQLAELIITHAKANTKDLEEKIKNTLSKLKQHFLVKGYAEDELIGEVVYKINALKDGYVTEINVYVYPKPHSDIYLSEKILSSRLFDYVSKDYTRSLNGLGEAIKEKISPMIQILELQEEAEKLKLRIKQLEEELEKCREGEGEDP